MIKKILVVLFIFLNVVIFSDENIDMMLNASILKNNYYAAEQAINQGANVDNSNEKRVTALMYASSGQTVDFLSIIRFSFFHTTIKQEKAYVSILPVIQYL